MDAVGKVRETKGFIAQMFWIAKDLKIESANQR
jgi:hypothetical protein